MGKGRGKDNQPETEISDQKTSESTPQSSGGGARIVDGILLRPGGKKKDKKEKKKDKRRGNREDPGGIDENKQYEKAPLKETPTPRKREGGSLADGVPGSSNSSAPGYTANSAFDANSMKDLIGKSVIFVTWQLYLSLRISGYISAVSDSDKSHQCSVFLPLTFCQLRLNSLKYDLMAINGIQAIYPTESVAFELLKTVLG